jgi:hypothetical protein
MGNRPSDRALERVRRRLTATSKGTPPVRSCFPNSRALDRTQTIDYRLVALCWRRGSRPSRFGTTMGQPQL